MADGATTGLPLGAQPGAGEGLGSLLTEVQEKVRSRLRAGSSHLCSGVLRLLGLWKVRGCSRTLRKNGFRVLGNMSVFWVGGYREGGSDGISL